MAREWTNIDAHRMDKYLLLVRTVVRRVFAGIMEDVHGETEEARNVAEQQMALLEQFPLSPRERKVPDGLRYHVLDVYVDELERTIGQGLDEMKDDGREEAKETSEDKTRVLERLLLPVETVGKQGLSKGVRTRAKEVLADERVVRWRAKGEGDGGDDEDGQDEWGGLE
jgi:ribosomal RNA-processing protein 1